MCGRYALYGPQSRSRLRELFGVDLDDWPDRYNIAPDAGSPSRPQSGRVPIIRTGADGFELALVQWGLLPFWSKARYIKWSTFNARIETVATAASFRDPLKYRRCIVPASCFYEWQETARGKQPWRIGPADGDVLGFAGLWDRWGHGDEAVESCTVIVHDPDAAIADVHNRMPTILAPALYADWLNPAERDPARLIALLHANPGVPLARYAVGTAVSNARNEGPELVKPLG